MRSPSIRIGAVLDHLVAAHGDDPRAGQRERAARLGGVGGEAEARVDRRRRRLAAGEGARGADILREQVGPLAPVERAPIARPMEPVAGVRADPRLGQGLAVRGDIDRAARPRERHDIGLIALGPGDELLVGRQRELGGVLRDEVGLFLLAVEADRLEELLVLLAVGIEEDAVVAGAELRAGALLRDAPRRSAFGGDDIEAGIAAPQRGRQKAVAALAIGDQRSVGGKSGLDIMAGLGRDHRGLRRRRPKPA